MIAFFLVGKSCSFYSPVVCLCAASGKIYAAGISVQGFCRSLLAKSKAFLASRPKAWTLEGFPYCSVKNGSISSSTSCLVYVVAA